MRLGRNRRPPSKIFTIRIILWTLNLVNKVLDSQLLTTTLILELNQLLGLVQIVISIKTRIPLQRLVRRLTTPQSSLVEKSITRRLILIIAECLHGRRYSDLQLCIEYIHGLLNGRWLLLKRQLGAIWNDMLTLILFILKFIINIPASHHLGISNKFSLLWVLATAVLVDSICQVHQNRTFFLKLIW